MRSTSLCVTCVCLHMHVYTHIMYVHNVHGLRNQYQLSLSVTSHLILSKDTQLNLELRFMLVEVGGPASLKNVPVLAP